MTTKGKIKHYDIVLQRYIDKREYVKIYRTICNEEENLSGFILKMSKSFLLLQVSSDFMLDGYAIIRKDDFDSIRCNKFDKTQKNILKAEGILKTNYGIDENIPLTNWVRIFQNLRKHNYHIIIENINKDNLDFFIGSITRITKDSVSILNYDSTGKLDQKPTPIKLNNIKTVKFGDRYSTIFRKYLK